MFRSSEKIHGGGLGRRLSGALELVSGSQTLAKSSLFRDWVRGSGAGVQYLISFPDPSHIGLETRLSSTLTLASSPGLPQAAFCRFYASAARTTSPVVLASFYQHVIHSWSRQSRSGNEKHTTWSGNESFQPTRT